MSILGGSRESRDILLEKYVGGNHKEFKIIEAELAKIITMIKSNSALMVNKIDINVINNSDHNKLIERQFKQFFGLRQMEISWSTTADPNAYTFCKTYILLDKNFKESKDGRRTNDSLFIGATMHTGLVTSAGMNEKEILAIMLHEIGHNFYNSYIHTLSSAGLNLYSYVILGAMDLVGFNEIMSQANNMVRNFMSDQLGWVYKFVNSVEQFVYQITTLVPAWQVIYASPTLLVNMLNVQFLTRYNVEKHADSFAVDHGYGKELASGLNKLTRAQGTLGAKTVYQIPGLSWIYDLCDVQMEFIMGLVGSYPSPQNRIKEGIDRLKRSQSDPNISPTVKKELAAQIKAYEDYYYNYYLNVDENDNKKRIITWVYRKMIETVFKGKMDIRELTYVFLDTHRNK